MKRNTLLQLPAVYHTHSHREYTGDLLLINPPPPAPSHHHHPLATSPDDVSVVRSLAQTKGPALSPRSLRAEDQYSV